MARVLKTAAIVVGVAALAVTGYGLAIGATAAAAAGGAGIGALSISTAATALSAAAAVATVGANLLAKKPSATATSVSGNQERFTANKDQGVPYVMGRTQVSGWLIHRQTFDVAALQTKDNAFQTLFAVWGGGGPYQQLEAFKVDGTVVTFGTDPTAAIEPTEATGTFHGNMFLQARLGAVPEAAALHALDVAPFPTGWSAQSKLSGYASFAWTLRWDPEGKKFPSGVPQPSAILKGALTYDPRQDSTYPGGSGSCRPLDESTYVYSENPALHALTWALGRWQNGKRVLGIGMALAAIDVPAFVQAANVADANEWTIGGVVYSTDGKLDVLKKMLAACSGQPLQLGGTLSCEVDTPRVSLATITDADIIGDASVVATPTISERINGVIPSCRLEDHDWSIVPCDKVQVDAYVATDGRTRTKAITWELVQDADQVAELATYAICNAREFGPIVTPLKLRWVGYKPGDCLTIQSSNMGMDSQTVVIRNRHLDPVTAAVTLTMRSETVEKHAFSLGQTTNPPPTPGLQVIDRDTLLKPGVDASWPNIRDTDPVNHPIPEDGATYGAPGNSPVGSSTADGVLSAIAAAHSSIVGIQTDIANLEATYGSTASAAASAAAADAARQAAQAARDTASSLASAASGSASAASGSADLASTKAGQAGDSATAAHASEVAASGSSSASAGSASAAQGAAASASASAAAAQQSASLAAAVGSGSLNANPYFDAWANPAGPPDGWNWWDASFGINRVGGHSGHPYSANFNVTDAVHNSGIVYPTFPNGFGAFQIEIEGEATDWQGVGILAYFLKTDSSIVEACVLHCATEPDTSGYTSRDGGGGAYTRTWSKYYKTNIDGNIQRAQIYAMANWEGFPNGRAAKSVTIRKASIRPASSSESAVYAKASIDQLNSVAASAESARASTQSYLQGQINSNKASADSSISTLVTQQASAASSISSLSASVGSLSSSISVNSGAIASLQGRTGAFLQVVGVAGNNRVQATIYADANGGGGFDLIGDLTLTGQAKILGIVRATAFVTDDGVDLAALKPGMLAYKVAGSDGGNDRYLNAGDNLGPIAVANGGVLYGHEVDINIRGYFGGGTGGAEPNTFRVYVDLYVNSGGGWAYVGNVAALSTNGGDGIYFDQRFTLTAPYFSPYNYNQFGIFLHGDHASGHVYNFDWSAKIAAYK